MDHSNRTKEAEDLRDMALTLVDYIPMAAANKFAQWTDPDKLIHISHGPTSKLLTVQLNMGDDLVTVLSADTGGIRCYHPGLWVDHFKMAYCEAEGAIDQARQHRSESEKLEVELRYAPVDDSSVFGGRAK